MRRQKPRPDGNPHRNRAAAGQVQHQARCGRKRGQAAERVEGLLFARAGPAQDGI